jgi:hypothetical protein
VETEGRSFVWLPAWLPAAYDAWHRDALLLVTTIGHLPQRRNRALAAQALQILVLDVQVVAGHGRLIDGQVVSANLKSAKVDNSILSLTTTNGSISNALTRENAYQVLWLWWSADLGLLAGGRGSPSAIARGSHAVPLESHMKTVAALFAAVAIAALTLLPSTPALATGHRIQINEIYYNSPGTDTGSNSSLNAEWVRLYNQHRGL